MSGWSLSDIPDQHGKTVLITGANSGLGLASAEALAGRGAHVLLACRHAGRGAEALAKVRDVATGPDPELVTLDLADLASVQAATDDVRHRVDALDLLINNAGVMLQPRGRTADGFETHLG